MEELIEWRHVDSTELDHQKIILHFDGVEYILGRATKLGYGVKRFWWQFIWRGEVQMLMDNAVYNLRLDEPLEPTKEQINEWVTLNLWKILKEIKNEKISNEAP